jgi:hypothetical protein
MSLLQEPYVSVEVTMGLCWRNHVALLQEAQGSFTNHVALFQKPRASTQAP